MHVAEVGDQSPDQLIGQRRLARAAGSRNSDHRDGRRLDLCRTEPVTPVTGYGCATGRHLNGTPLLHPRQNTSQESMIVAGRSIVGLSREVAGAEVALLEHEIDHPLQTEFHSLIGREHPADAISLELGNLFFDDDTAAATENLDMPGVRFVEQVIHVLEVLHMTALVRRNGDALHILLDGGLDDFPHGAVVAEVDHLGPARLQDPADDIDRRVVAVEKTGRRHESDVVLRFVHADPLLA